MHAEKDPHPVLLLPPLQNSLEVRLPLDRGIAGHVARTGRILNIRDAQSHALFYRNIDQATGFTTRNILCFPIKDEKKVIGVAELCNKATGLYFTKVMCAIEGSNKVMFGIRENK